jgi:hypothetical protein
MQLVFFSLSNCTYVGSLQMVVSNVLGEIFYIIVLLCKMFHLKCPVSNISKMYGIYSKEYWFEKV